MHEKIKKNNGTLEDIESRLRIKPDRIPRVESIEGLGPVQTPASHAGDDGR